MIDKELVDSALRIYRAMLAADPADAGAPELADPAGLSGPETREAENYLRRLGLIRQTVEGRPRMIALPPQAAVRSLIADEEAALSALNHRLDFTREALRLVATEFQSAHSQHLSVAEVEVVRGRDRVRAALESASACAQRTVAALHPGPAPTAEDLEYGLARNLEVLRRGVEMRTVHLHSVARLPHMVKYLDALQDAGGSVRQARTLPTRLIITDSALAILPVPPIDGEVAVMVVRGLLLVRFLESLFDHCWSSASSLGVAPRPGDGPMGGPTGPHAEVLAMLAAGMRDEGMARRLGVSVRTVRRMVAELMEQLRAGSRFEAGVAAARAGWLDAE
ncbi:MAG: LuxR C-terminal-related transcriptional regulator [Catenulispora sp.]